MDCLNCKVNVDKLFSDNLCSKCHKNKLKREYYQRHKDDINKKAKERRDTDINKEKRRVSDSSYYSKNKEIISIRQKTYYELNKEKIKEQRKLFHENNPENRKNQRKKQLYKPIYKLEQTYRRRCRRCLIYPNRCEELLGCTKDFLLKWFEFLFSKIDNMMSLNNHGEYWEIDHVKPVSTFDLNDEEQVKLCFNWKNLAPLEKSLNRKKSNKIDDNMIINHNKLIEQFLIYNEAHNTADL